MQHLSFLLLLSRYLLNFI